MSRTKQRIGDYRIIAPVGAGGFATVYRALDERTGREVAIKVLAENHSLKSEMRRRFIREIDLLATVNSPSIAKVYRTGRTESDQPYMVLELADRGDLRRRLEEIRRSHQRLTRADLTMLAYHLFDALGTLHEADIIHRDVSPANILIKARRSNAREMGTTLLEPGERFLLADLGYGKDMEGGSGLTAGGGTKGYAAPEQLEDVTMVDHRADIFSATAIMEWAAHDSEYNDDLEPFFEIGLAADPDDRYDSMDAWHEAFGAALGSHVEPGEAPARRSRLLAGLSLAVLVAAGAGLAALLIQGNATPTETAAPAGPDASADPSPTTTLVEVESQSTATEASTVTVAPAQPTTTDAAPSGEAETAENDQFANSPRAFLLSPPNGSLVPAGQDLKIGGRARFDEGIKHVELVVEHQDEGLYWNKAGATFIANRDRFEHPVDGDDPSEVTWELTIPAEELIPGNYRVRVWARGAGDQSDPKSDTITFLVR